MHPILRVSALAVLVSACASKTGANDTGAAGAEANSSDPHDDGTADEAIPPATIDAEAAFDVMGGPYDLAMAPDGRLFISIQESRIDVWDPETEWVEEHTRRAGSVFGIAWHGEHLYYTTSNHRQSGALLRLDGREGTVLATAAGTTVFREPTDLAVAPDGRWVVPDPTVGTLFIVSADGSTVGMMDPGVREPSTVAVTGNAVYVGGTDGVTRIEWPDGDPERIDDRPVNGLHAPGEALLGAGPRWGAFDVSADSEPMGNETIRLAGRMAGDDTLFVSDWGGATVWAIAR